MKPEHKKYQHKDLPLTLDKEETYRLLGEIKNGSKDARDILVSHNIRFVVYLVNKYFSTVAYDQNDLVQIGSIGLIKAVDTYNFEKTTNFSTYASICINNEIKMFLRKLKKHQNVISFEEKFGNYESEDELKVENRLSDNTNVFEGVEKKSLMV